MKKTLGNPAVILLLIIQIAACQKKPVIVPPGESDVCQIKQLTMSTSTYFQTDTAMFTYNNPGNPVSVLLSHSGTGNPNALFRYDAYNRLTDFIGAYSYSPVTDASNMPAAVSFEYWFRYVYADQNPSSMPVRDTVRVIGNYRDGRFINTSGTYIENLVYDSQNRIIQVNRNVEGFDQSLTYSYDGNGNLVIPNVIYDNKKNFRQTNKVWMLIDKNFSKNNPFTATTYNEAGFPTTFGPPAPRPYHDNFLFRQMNMLTMTYSCSIAPLGQKYID